MSVLLAIRGVKTQIANKANKGLVLSITSK